MKLTIATAELQKAVALTKGAARNTITEVPSKYLRIEAELLSVSVTANDGLQEATVKTDEEVNIRQGGVVVLEAAKLSEILRRASSFEISLECAPDAARAKLTAGKTVYKLHTLPVADFVAFPEPDGATVSISAAAFSSAMALLTPATQTDDPTKAHTRSINLREHSELQGFAATDGKQLLMYEVPVSDGFAELTIPSDSIKLLTRAFASSDEMVQIKTYESGNMICFTSPVDGITIKTMLLEGTYPNWPSMIDSMTHQEWICVDASLFIRTLDAVLPIVGVTTLTVHLQERGDLIYIVATDSGQDFIATIPVEGRGGSGERAFLSTGNPHLLVNAARLFSGMGTKIRINYGAPEYPMVFASDGDEDDSAEPVLRASAILMPLQLKRGHQERFNALIEQAVAERTEGGEPESPDNTEPQPVAE